jgi:hypothetical protein
MRFAPCHFALGFFLSAASVHAQPWTELDASALALVQDDDLERHRAEPAFLQGVQVSELRFRENGFDWHLLRFVNADRPDGPLWVVPHDDENAAFDAMIAALRKYGGTGIAVDTGPASTRRQPGSGPCGVRPMVSSACDPNRNFDRRTPLFSSAILDLRQAGQPVIALHTNSDGFAGDGEGGRGDISMLDAAAYRAGVVRPRANGYFGNGTVPQLDNPDIYAILPYARAKGLSAADVKCRQALNAAGANVWHEHVGVSDGSLSNHVALNLPDVRYMNAEARRDADLAEAAQAQLLMVDAYLGQCRPE